MSENNNVNNNNAGEIILSILSDHQGIKVDESCMLTMTESSKIFTPTEKELCKIFNFTSEWNIDKFWTILDELEPKEFPNLLVLIIKIKVTNSSKGTLNHYDYTKEKLLKFGSGRPLLIHLKIGDENLTKFYFKEESWDHFELAAENENVDFMKFSIPIVNQITSSWRLVIESSIFRNFLKLFDNLYSKLIFEVTKSGSKADLLTLLDAPAEFEGRVLSLQAQFLISKVWFDKRSDNDNIEDDAVSENDESSTTSSNENDGSSILSTAVENKNLEIVDYLITYWTHLIQELSFIHKIKISTIAFRTRQLDVLCDLLDIADYPFPDDFDLDDEQNHKRFDKIILERLNFENAIKTENFKKIDKFIDNNSNLKYAFGIDNYSAISKAIEMKKFAVFYYLKSLGFEGEDCHGILSELCEKDRVKATLQAVKQRKSNVKEALLHDQKSILLLVTKSLIHNRRTSKIMEKDYRKKILNWFQDINDIAPEMLDVAASCDNLKIIFDFESITVENASLSGPNSLGATYPTSKWIFVGAKIADKNREQKIKGVLAHELCHFVMRMVYANQENPYFEDSKDMKDEFEAIAKAIDKWSAKDAERPDDECGGIISTVFTLYSPEEFHMELIVRVVHILIHFDDDNTKTKHLQEKYKRLFDFWYHRVIPELSKYLQKRKEIITLNQHFGLLTTILNSELMLCVCKNGIQKLVNSKLSIVKTNIPSMCFVDVYMYLKHKFNDLLDSKNLFIEPEKLLQSHICYDYRQACILIDDLNIIVDCSKMIHEDTLNKIITNANRFIFIISNQKDYETLLNLLQTKKLRNATSLDLIYNWNDLEVSTQQELLKNEIKFQNNDVIIKELLTGEEEELSEIINDNFLNLLFHKKQISVNAGVNFMIDKKFSVLCRNRNILKVNKTTAQESNLTQDEMLSDVQSSHYVLVSDKAGTGKSWLLRNIAKECRNNYPNKWTTLVDLKMYKDVFCRQLTQPEFESFMIKKILKLKCEIEINIFKKLYKNGKVIIFFDGFDEISQSCAEIVKQLIKAFNFNGGNQMWISTRNQFKVNLQTELNLNITFSFDKFTEEDGKNLMAYTWIIEEEGVDIEENTDLVSIIERSPNRQNYLDCAENLIKLSKDSLMESCPVGMPAFYEIMAKFFKDKKVLPEGKIMVDYYSDFDDQLTKRVKAIKLD